MSKILKQKYNRTLIILLATIIMILLAIYIPYIVSAVEFSGFSNKTSPSASPGTINFSDINVNDTITIGSAQHIFTNENIYCIEKGQSLKGEQEHTYRYILKVTYDSEGITWVVSVNNKGIDFDIDNNPNDAAEFWKFVNALGYILSFTGEFERPGGTSFSNTDPYQQALWELVYRYPRVADWMFYTELSNKEIELDDNPKAKEIYDNAINYTGAQGEFTIYVLRDETSVDGDNEYEYDYQTLILV